MSAPGTLSTQGLMCDLQVPADTNPPLLACLHLQGCWFCFHPIWAISFSGQDIICMLNSPNYLIQGCLLPEGFRIFLKDGKEPLCYLESQSSSRTINSKLFKKAGYIKVAVNQHNENNGAYRNSLHIWYTGVLFFYLVHSALWLFCSIKFSRRMWSYKLLPPLSQ